MKEYEISIADPFEYNGPNPIIAIGKGIVHGPKIPNWQNSDFLLEVKKPFKYENEEIKYLLVTPRHESSTINDVQNKPTPIGISKVLPGHTVQIGVDYKENDVKYWAIGGIKPKAS